MKAFLIIVFILALAGPAFAQDSTPAGLTQTGTIVTCNKWYLVQKGNSCATVTHQFGITLALFLAWNPAVSSDCTVNFWGGYAYCVGVGTSVPSTSTTSERTTTTTTKKVVPTETTPPGPIMTGSPANCNNWYLVVRGDTCGKIESKFGISHDQFLAWNPVISADCSTNFWLGEAYCVGVGASVTTGPTGTGPTSSHTISSSGTGRSTKANTTTTPYWTRLPVTSWNISTPTVGTTWPPTRTQAGQPSYCNEWHLVQAGDTCASIAAQYTTWMALADFFAWNPVVGSDCSGLYLYYWVCVGIQPQTSLTLVYPTGTTAIPSALPWTPTPLPSVDFRFTPLPTQGPLPTNCANYYLSRSGDTCRKGVASLGYLTQDQFLQYNDYLDGNCDGLWAGVYYCVSEYNVTQNGIQGLPLPSTVSTKPSSGVASNTTATCTTWYRASDDNDCDIIPAIFGTFSRSDFLAWNPSVDTGCEGLVVDGTHYYCVAVPGTPTARTAAITTPSPTPKAPVQAGIVPDCISWWLVKPADTCDIITTANKLTLQQFLAWNPAVASNPTTGNTTGTSNSTHAAICAQLLPNYDVCVLIEGMEPGGNGTTTSSTIRTIIGTTTQLPGTTASTSRTLDTTHSTSTGSQTTDAPSPVQSGIVADCRRFYFVERGDKCGDIARTSKIGLKWPGTSCA
ncbi:hypothetical protein Sste5346_005456 [Sporothrix stenoceras]|uniref:LysM domain-containing protein n=1 Tax=Sporothrix stenoceras TaxID=5173 RepID=A0ABR3Z346_9PEZI